ncbi:putative quinol monooxygenase [Tenacibaculum salmonis]|uniref:putative quinol monooxygenase n=1 Tax=Tenacibaculum sp. P3-BQ1 TaxID=3232310 RepID=UPI0034DEF8F7
MKKTIVAQISINKKFETKFLNLAATIVTKSNAEEGCITYRLHKDIYNENAYLFYEEYLNETAVDFHNSSSHFNVFIDEISSMLLKEPVINIY